MEHDCLFILKGGTFVPSWCPAKPCSFCWEFYERIHSKSLLPPLNLPPPWPLLSLCSCGHVHPVECVWRSGGKLRSWPSSVSMYADVLFFSLWMPVSLARSQASGSPSVSPSHLPARALALWMHSSASSFTWVPRIQTQDLIFMQRALSQRSHLPTLCFSPHAFQLVVNGLRIQHDHWAILKRVTAFSL